MGASLAKNTIPVTRMQAAAIQSAIESRLEATDPVPDANRLSEQGRELLVTANVLQCVEQRRFPCDEDARRLLLELEAEAEDDCAGETADEDTLVMLRAMVTYLRVTRQRVGA